MFWAIYPDLWMQILLRILPMQVYIDWWNRTYGG